MKYLIDSTVVPHLEGVMHGPGNQVETIIMGHLNILESRLELLQDWLNPVP